MRHSRAVSLSPDSVEIVYMDDDSDLRADGLVFQSHTIVMSRLDPELEDEMADLETSVTALLEAGMRRWAGSMPVSAEQLQERIAFEDDDDEEEEGE